MITRFAGLTPTRSRAVAHDDLVFTVAVAPDPGGAPDALKVLKVFPARLKRDFNLWDILEEC